MKKLTVLLITLFFGTISLFGQNPIGGPHNPRTIRNTTCYHTLPLTTPLVFYDTYIEDTSIVVELFFIKDVDCLEVTIYDMNLKNYYRTYDLGNKMGMKELKVPLSELNRFVYKYEVDCRFNSGDTSFIRVMILPIPSVEEAIAQKYIASRMGPNKPNPEPEPDPEKHMGTKFDDEIIGPSAKD